MNDKFETDYQIGAIGVGLYVVWPASLLGLYWQTPFTLSLALIAALVAIVLLVLHILELQEHDADMTGRAERLEQAQNPKVDIYC